MEVQPHSQDKTVSIWGLKNGFSGRLRYRLNGLVMGGLLLRDDRGGWRDGAGYEKVIISKSLDFFFWNRDQDRDQNQDEDTDQVKTKTKTTTSPDPNPWTPTLTLYPPLAKTKTKTKTKTNTKTETTSLQTA